MNTFKSNGLRLAGIGVALAVLGTSCGESDSEKPGGTTGGSGGSGGSETGGTGGTTGGSGGTSGAPTGGTGGSGTGGATGGAGGAGTGGATGGSGGATGGSGGATGGSGGATGGSGGAAGGDGGPAGGAAGATGGSAGATGGAAGSAGSTGGSAGAGGGGMDAGLCSNPTNFTLAVHITMDVTWPGTISTNMGTGKVHLWNRAAMTANGSNLTGKVNSCGTSLPDIVLNGVGATAAGGMFVSIEIPHASWDSPSIPVFDQKGTFTGFEVGNMTDMEYTVALVGLTMADPVNAPWPATYTGVTGQDAEGDGQLGITGVPKNGNGYVYPPTALGIFGSAPAAKNVYIASRNVLALKGTVTKCEELAGDVNVKFFDNHVIGCLTTMNAPCNADQTKFVDDSRTKYTVTKATFVSKRVPETASCADVRAALP
jgi:hypothetical protein